MLYPSNKEKKRKEILNNDLAVLLSHDKKVYSLSREEREEVQAFIEDQLRKGYI